jgi:hypothetical protein
MSRRLTAADRSRLIRLASTLPVGSPERKAILAGLGKEARFPPRSEDYNRVDDADGFWKWPIFAVERETGLRFQSLPQNLGNMIFFLNTAIDAWEKKIRDESAERDALGRTASGVPREFQDQVVSVVEGFTRRVLRMSNTPDVRVTSDAVTIEIEGWTGTPRELEVKATYDYPTIIDQIGEALQSSDFSVDIASDPVVQVKQGTAYIRVPLRPYDPAEDSPL